ncbi:MAG: hypothetical protein ACRDT0_18795 [Pseudonocardiaceae bacterium]
MEGRGQTSGGAQQAVGQHGAGQPGGVGGEVPLGYPQVNRAWMWGALLAVSIAGWTHQLTATPGPDGQPLGHGIRDGQAMIATLRHTLIRVPARLIRHAGQLTLTSSASLYRPTVATSRSTLLHGYGSSRPLSSCSHVSTNALIVSSW